MGSGESTARRIAMQRSDEGVIQISEDVMLRLYGHPKPVEEPKGELLKEGELIIQEDTLTKLLEEAYSKGRREASGDIHHELEKIGGRVRTLKGNLEKQRNQTEELAKENKLKTQELETVSKERDNVQMEKQALQLEVEKLKVHDDAREKELKGVEEAWRKELDDRESRLLEIKKDFVAERERYNQQAAERENVLNEEFDKGMESIKSKLKPAQKITVCNELQQKALDCFRLHPKQPLKCSNEVQDFTKCIERAQLNVLKS